MSKKPAMLVPSCRTVIGATFFEASMTIWADADGGGGGGGVGAPLTVTLVTAVAEPLEPVHVIVYCELPAAVGFTNQIPRVAREPLHAPLALHEVVLALDQCRAVDFPRLIEFGHALKLTVGAAELPDAAETGATCKINGAIAAPNTALSFSMWTFTVDIALLQAKTHANSYACTLSALYQDRADATPLVLERCKPDV
jgi:hypothetical protein